MDQSRDGVEAGASDTSLFEAEGIQRARLKIAHLRMIVALEDQGQVSAAAALLAISQPAASRMIGEIEALVGETVCQRLPRGIQLTAFGRALARRARSILLEMREMDREIDDLRHGRGGQVFIGAVTAPAIELAVPAIDRLRRQNPKIEINVQVDTSRVLAQELLASRHDFIIARIPDDLNPRLFTSRIIGEERIALIIRRGHPLSGIGPLSLEQLTGFDWVFQPGGSLLRRTVEAAFLARNAPLPARIVSTTSLLLTLVMVSKTDAIAPVAEDVARFIREDDGLAGAIEMVALDRPIASQPYSLITLADRTLSPAAQRLHDAVVDVAAGRISSQP